MRVLVIGSGGREHALCWKLARDHEVDKLYCTPGNGGISQIAKCLSCKSDPESLANLAADLKIDLTIVGPEQPLVDGVVDIFGKRDLRIFGPNRLAALLEGRKVFAKEFMARYGIPTAPFTVCRSVEDAITIIQSRKYSFPLVIKADGLAAGKGVTIAQDEKQAIKAIRFWGAKGALVIEECLFGRECSFIVFTDGETILPMVTSQDYKKAYDGDQSPNPNTGGMGSVSTSDLIDELLTTRIMREIVRPTIAGIAEEGAPYRGVLYFGLMFTADGPKVLEYNVRFGDPETQVILPRLESSLLEILLAISEGNLAKVKPQWSNDSTVCVVLASAGYPGDYQTGFPISGIEQAAAIENVTVFHAGTRIENGHYFTAGGRVLGVTAISSNLGEAREKAYRAVNEIHFEGMRYRQDIGLDILSRVPK